MSNTTAIASYRLVSNKVDTLGLECTCYKFVAKTFPVIASSMHTIHGTS